MTEEVSPSQEPDIGLTMKDVDGQRDAGIIQNVGAKRRRIDAEVQSNDESHHSAIPPVHSRYPHLSQRPQSTPPVSAEFSIPAPNRMITRSLSKSHSDLLNRAQTASPSDTMVSDSLRQVSSTTTMSRAFTQSPTLTLKQAGPIPRVDYGGQVRRVFSQPNFHPGSVSYQNQILNHPLNGFATEQTHPAVQQLHQAHQTIQSLQSQLNTSAIAIRTLESRVINSESLLSSKSVELDQARNEIQSLRFQMHQQGLVSVSRMQLNEEKNRHSRELEDMRERLGVVVRRVNSDREVSEGLKKGMEEEIHKRDSKIEESERVNRELIKDNESVNRDLVKTEEDLAGLREINKVLVQKLDEHAIESKKKDQDILLLQNENVELRGSLGKSNKDITLLTASKEALNRVVDTYRKTNQEVQSDLTKEKERSEEIRRVGWEELNALRKEYDSMKNRHEQVINANEEIKRSYEIVCQSEKAAKDRLNIERNKFNNEKKNREKEDESKKGLRDKIYQVENDLSNSKKINQEISEEKDHLVRELRQKERRYQEVSQQKTDLSTRLENYQKEYDNLDKKYKEQAKLKQVSKTEVKGLKKGNATLNKKNSSLEESNKAHKKDKEELNRQINLLKKEIIDRKQDHKEVEQFRVLIEDLSRTVDDLTGQITDLQGEKRLLARTILELSNSCQEFEEIKRRLEERVERNDHKVEELENFVRRIILARSKYHDKFELKDGAKSDSSKAQFDGLIRSYNSIWTTPNLISARERKRQDKLLKWEVKRSTIPQKLDWLDYWIKFIDFALEDLEQDSVDQVSSHISKDDHPVHD